MKTVDSKPHPSCMDDVHAAFRARREAQAAAHAKRVQEILRQSKKLQNRLTGGK